MICSSRIIKSEQINTVTMSSEIPESASPVAPLSSFLIIAGWFGLCTGLVEGVAIIAVSSLKLARFDFALSLDNIWISLLINFCFFLVLGLLAWFLARLARRALVFRISLVTFAALMLADWLALIGPLHLGAGVVLAVGLATAITRHLLKHATPGLAFMRRTLPWLTALPLLAMLVIQGWVWLSERSAAHGLPASSPGSPSVLIIVVDALRADHVSAYGYSHPTTPNIDKLAQQGALFENAIAASSWTLPSHASILSGRYPHDHGAELVRLDRHSRTIAEELYGLGYRTAAFSANSHWFCRWAGFGRGFIRFEDTSFSPRGLAERTVYGRALLKCLARQTEGPASRTAADINTAVVRWLERDPRRPFFAVLNYFDVHDPYLRGWGAFLERHLFGRLPSRNDRERVQEEIGIYDRRIALVDSQIGNLLAEINRRGWDKNLLVVITSDHGQLFGEHGLWGHGNALYRELIRVPLILYKPGIIPQGLRISDPVSLTALPATTMQLVTPGAAQPFPGISLMEFWHQSRSVEHPVPLSELARQPTGMPGDPSYDGWLESLVSRQWHYILHQKAGEALYDWENDPEELYNLAGKPQADLLLAEFRRQLNASRSPHRLPSD